MGGDSLRYKSGALGTWASALGGGSTKRERRGVVIHRDWAAPDVGGKAAVLYDGEPIQAFHGFAEFSSESDTIPVLAIGMPSRKHYPHRNLCTCDFRKFGGRTFLGQFFSKGDVQETRVNTREEVWWTWSGSNRRPLPCHFPQRSVALRHTVTPVDTKRAVFMGLLPMLLPLQTYGATPSDRA